jgi:hypothetical protein
MTAAFFLSAGSWAQAATVYLNQDNISVSLGSNTTVGGSFNNTVSAGGFVDIDDALTKVIDAPSADASEDHTQVTHIWWTAPGVGGKLELVFDFGISYDITTLHFWNYAFDDFSVDLAEFSFFNSIGGLIGSQNINPAPSGSEANITAQDYALVSPLNVRTVSVLLSGTNGQVDFQNIGFTANVSDPDLDPDVNVVPLPAGLVLLLTGLAGMALVRRQSV